jgi:hypothetical protein
MLAEEMFQMTSKKFSSFQTFPDPALVLDLDPVALLLEEAQDLGRVRGLAEDVEILGRPRNAGVAGERVGARQQELKSLSFSSFKEST